MRTRMSLSDAILSSPRRPGSAMIQSLAYPFVMPGLVPRIHVFVFSPGRKSAWMAGSSPAMTASRKRLGVTLDHRLQLGGGIVTEVAVVANVVEYIDVL